MTELDAVLAALGAGAPVIIPTDTVYGLAADPRIEGATEKLFSLKGRPGDKALPVLGASLEALREVALFDDRAQEVAERFWPGPLTLVLRREEGLEWDLGGAGDSTVAVRIPAHPLTLDLLRITGPLAVTSANPSGAPPAVTAEMAVATFGKGIPILEGGRAKEGLASTVLSLVDEPRIIRSGAVPAEDLLET